MMPKDQLTSSEYYMTSTSTQDPSLTYVEIVVRAANYTVDELKKET